MKTTQLVKIAGGFSFFFFLFHVPFYWILDWKNGLACLSTDNWAIFMCFNIISIVLLFLMGYLSMFQAKEITSPRLGKAVLLFFSWFYFFRIVAEFVFFDNTSILASIIIISLCAVPAILYSIPVFRYQSR